MNKIALIACLSLIAGLNMNSNVHAADLPLAPPDTVVAQNGLSDKKELLMFFEEQDLVTATKRHTTLRKAPAIATIITADEIRNMGARNLLDVLKLVPGLGVSVNEYGTMMIEVRGIRTSLSEKILVMIDGHSLNRNMNGSSIIYNMAGSLPVENIRQVEVVRGPGSALYGNSAFVATINVITRNAEEINGLELKAGGGSFETYKANMVGGRSIGDKLTVSGSLDYYKSNGPKLTVEADTLAGTPFSRAPGAPDLRDRNTDAFIKAGYGDLTLRGHYLAKKVGMYIGLASALNDSYRPEFENYWAELAYDLRISEGLSTNMKLHYDYWEQTGASQIFPRGFLGSFPAGMIGEPLAKTRSIGYEQQFDWDPFEGNHLILGVSFEVLDQFDVKQLTNFDPNTFAYTYDPLHEVANWNRNVTRRIWATYLQDEWQLLERLNLTAGVRYDNYSDFGNTFNPRAGLVWSFLENADLKLLYGQAFRAPNFVELYDANNPVILGNAGLNPEKIRTYEAGVTYRLNRYFAADLNYFYSTIEDLIAWDMSVKPVPRFANIGNSITQGVELGVSGSCEAGLNWKFNYAWQDPRDADSGKRLPYVPSHRASGSVNYAANRYLNLHTDVLWTGSRPRDNGDSRSEMPAYATVDLALTLKNFYKTMEIQATVRNLFDERYKDPDTSVGAANLTGTGPKVPGDFPREGISWLVTASCKF
ncbi:MAG: TonB-dependent receptor [Pseudomonadota bacterium]